MGDCQRAGEPSRYKASQLGRLLINQMIKSTYKLQQHIFKKYCYTVLKNSIKTNYKIWA